MSISVRFQYKGQFQLINDRLLYKKGRVFNKINVDPDLLSKMELEGFLEDEIGKLNVKELWYLEAGKSINDGLRQIVVDNDILLMVSSLGGDKTAHVYVVQSNDVSPTSLIKASQSKPLEPLTEEHIDDALEETGIVLGSDSSTDDEDYNFNESGDEEDDIFEENVDETEDDLAIVLSFEDEAHCAEELELVEDSENLLSLSDVDGEKQPKYPEFNAISDLKNAVSLKSGMIFGSNDIFRRALRQYSIENGYDFYYLHNDKSKVSAYCKYRCDCSMKHSRKRCECKKIYCGFKACARRLGQDGTFQLKTWEPKHTCGCGWQQENRKVTSKWLAEKYIEHHRCDPKWSINGFISTVSRDYGVDITYTQAWRARVRAFMMTQGDASGQYAKVWDYAATLMKYDHGSSAFVKVCYDVVERPLFQRLYICLDACKKGFIMGCRPIIGLDGCHLKGAYTGQVLSAVAKDGNENIFPIAFAVVEAERKETWCWFLENLMRDLGDLTLTFMSDRQKGLLEALNLIVPMADTRVCVRHLYNNFKVKWPGKALKDALWAAARAFNEVDFEESMAYMKSLDEGAYAYLMRADPNTWSRHKFKYFSKSDTLLNNMCETFNNYILRSRDKPILTMCEWIRRGLMKRFTSKRSGMGSYSGLLTPKAQKKIEFAISEASRTCKAQWGGGDRCEVDQFGNRFVVDYVQKTCGCNKWDLTGIPCVHAIACILKRRGKVENFVDKYYSKETYMKAYGHIIEPIPGPKQWVKTAQTPPDPPFLIVQPGRPKKARRRELGEEQKKRHIRVCAAYKCSQCGQQGHNKKKCINPPKKANIPKPHNKGGRPVDPNTIKFGSSSKRRIHPQAHQKTLNSSAYEVVESRAARMNEEVDRTSNMVDDYVGFDIPSETNLFPGYQIILEEHQQPSQFSWGASQASSAETSKTYFPSSQARNSIMSSKDQLAGILHRSGGQMEASKKTYLCKPPWKS